MFQLSSTQASKPDRSLEFQTAEGPRLGLPCADAAVQARLREALSRLMQAEEYARDLNTDPWQFAIQAGELCEVGLTGTDLRWLVLKGCVQFAVELEAIGSQRQFKCVTAFGPSERTCLIVTDLGKRLLEQLSGRPTMTASDRQVVGLPLWDRTRGELYVGEKLVKRFRLPAPNQRRILSAFQEEQWPMRIDDPLPPHPEIDSKRRLHHTLVALNRNQQRRLIHFEGDGTGQGICWTVRPD